MNDIPEPFLKLKSVLPYLLNLKAMIGLVLILYAMYTGYTGLTTKWSAFISTSSNNGKLLQNKNQLHAEEAKLKSISEALDKLSSKIIQVAPDSAPDLVAIKIAQNIVDLAEATQNTYVSLEPIQSNDIINVDEAVTLSIKTPSVSPASLLAGVGRKKASDAKTKPALLDDSSGLGEKIGKDSSTAMLKSFQYKLVLQGTYANLAAFIHQVIQLKEFVVIDSLVLAPIGKSATFKDDLGLDLDQSNEISLSLIFSIPWQ